MDPNLWRAETTRIQDVYNSAGISSAGSFIDIQGNLQAIAGNLYSGQDVLNTALARQDVTFNIINTERTRLQGKKDSVDNAYANTQRMIQLNNNYQKRYWDYTKIIIVWVGVLALYLILNLLVQYVPVIPSILTDILVLIAVVAAAVYSFYIYNNLRNFDLMNYGQINPAPPSLTKDQVDKNAATLANQQLPSASQGNLPTNPKELACLTNGYFYNTNSGVTTCYKSPNSNLDNTNPGKLSGVGTNAVTLQGFQNIQADGEYEFSQYSKL
jgi:hypothetical protein